MWQIKKTLETNQDESVRPNFGRDTVVSRSVGEPYFSDLKNCGRTYAEEIFFFFFFSCLSVKRQLSKHYVIIGPEGCGPGTNLIPPYGPSQPKHMRSQAEAWSHECKHAARQKPDHTPRSRQCNEPWQVSNDVRMIVLLCRASRGPC